MPIRFDAARMDAVKESHARWWEGSLSRPLISIILPDAYDDGRPPLPLLSQANCHDLSRPAEEIVEAWDRWLSRFEFLGDAYPQVSLDVFGPGVLSAFTGGILDNASGAVWFRGVNKPISEISVKYDPENVWAKRIKDICRAGTDRWQGGVIMGMPDLGGVLDVAAALCGTEILLFALTDEPEEVKRLSGEIRTAWHEAYADFASVLAGQHGYTDWNGLLSTAPSYILQCDFSAMIGKEAYDTFVLPDVAYDTETLENTIYHLDGAGALRHLESILTLPALNAVQWVPGAGSPPSDHWPDVFRRIIGAGKGWMMVDGPDQFVFLQKELHGTPFCRWYFPAGERNHAEELLSIR